MTQEELMTAVRSRAFEGAVEDSALKPVGRMPHQVLVTLWEWYTALPERDQALVRHAMQIGRAHV